MLTEEKAEGVDIELRRYSKEEPIRELRASNEENWSFPLSSWAFYYKLRQMEWIVQMGFELDIYQVDELAGMYWYVVLKFLHKPHVSAEAIFIGICSIWPAPGFTI